MTGTQLGYALVPSGMMMFLHLMCAVLWMRLLVFLVESQKQELSQPILVTEEMALPCVMTRTLMLFNSNVRLVG
jgi:hypothetical protein